MPELFSSFGVFDTIDLEAAAFSDAGPNRQTNEDALGSFTPDDPLVGERKGSLFVLADGVGGHESGEVASALAVETVVEEYYSPSNHGRIEPALRHAVQTGNLRVFDLAQRHPEYRSMQTTLTAVALAGSDAYVAHVGDSRLYRWRDGGITQLTSDHSEAAELVRMRVVSPERLREHPGRSVLTRTLGGRLIVRPDFFRSDIKAGDQFVMCTDGLWAEVEDEEMSEILGRHSAKEACRALAECALSRDAGDNVSLWVIKVVAVPPGRGADGSRDGLLSSILQRIVRA